MDEEDIWFGKCPSMGDIRTCLTQWITQSYVRLKTVAVPHFQLSSSKFTLVLGSGGSLRSLVSQNPLCAAHLSLWGCSCDFATPLQWLPCRPSHTGTVQLQLTSLTTSKCHAFRDHDLVTPWPLKWDTAVVLLWKALFHWAVSCKSKHSVGPVRIQTRVCLSSPFLQCG